MAAWSERNRPESILFKCFRMFSCWALQETPQGVDTGKMGLEPVPLGGAQKQTTDEGEGRRCLNPYHGLWPRGS